MSLDLLRAAMGEKTGEQMFRVRNAITHAACQAVPEARRDRWLNDIWLGAVRGLVSPFLRTLPECLAELRGAPELLERDIHCWIPAKYAEHILRLASPDPVAAAEPAKRKAA